ncbi:retropepsin-like aspartic protease [Pannus brasiliensis CCIBt3594]|uniref:Retropepsin-like aspartic protease n=1 Tax=Pannus brasiliensis CCIBt3594 TaxID=1427578 RepID=A0AAW9QMB4_9CHRO
MNKSLSALVLSIGLSFFTPAFLARAGSECFLQAPNGRQIDLSRLCGEESVVTPAKVFHLPIVRRVGGVPVVSVTFNERHRYEMLFDTGASETVVTEAMAEKIGVKKEIPIIAKTAAGTITAHAGRVSSVSAGDLIQRNAVVGIAPGLEGNGLLGQNFFRDYDVTIKRDVIELRPRH